MATRLKSKILDPEPLWTSQATAVLKIIPPSVSSLEAFHHPKVMARVALPNELPHIWELNSQPCVLFGPTHGSAASFMLEKEKFERPFHWFNASINAELKELLDPLNPLE
jgi:hypothetical protein